MEDLNQNGQENEKNKNKKQVELVEINQNKEYVGLENLGNTCYLNSLLQALSGSQFYLKFAQNIVKNKLLKLNQDDEETDSDILYNFIILLLQLCYHDQDADTSYLYNLICNDSRLFQMNEECDAHELNLYIQDKLITQIPIISRQKIKQSDAISLIEDKIQANSTNKKSKSQSQDDEFKESRIAHSNSLTDSDKQSLIYGQNPLLAQYCISLECKECIKNGCEPNFKTESQLDINIDIPVPRNMEDAEQPVSIIDLIENQFKSQSISGYKCIKCSLRQYLLKYAQVSEPNELFFSQKIDWKIDDEDIQNQLKILNFFHKLYRKQGLDTDQFKESVKKFKRKTGIKSKQQLDEVEVIIQQHKKMVKPPKLLCLHLNRLSYNTDGNMFINRRFVEFHEFLDLSQSHINCFKTKMRYKLVSSVEHFGSISFGHYIATKRINQPINIEDTGKFLMCNDQKVYQIDVSEVLKTRAFMLFYEKI